MATDYSASGFVVKPKIELDYHFTDQLSVFAAARYDFRSANKNNSNFWKPQGSDTTGNVYSYDQFTNGMAR